MSKLTKFDNGKSMVSLVEPSFIIGMADVLTWGASKYSIDNWKQATENDIRRYKDALLRHILAEEEIDEETGLSHNYHAACNLMFLEYFRQQKGNNNAK